MPIAQRSMVPCSPRRHDPRQLRWCINANKYVVINSGLTIDEREYHGDYSMPKLGDLAILKVAPGSDTPDIAFATLFDELWRLR